MSQDKQQTLTSKELLSVALFSGVCLGFGLFGVYSTLSLKSTKQNRLARLANHYQEPSKSHPTNDLNNVSPVKQIKILRAQNAQLENLLTIARTSRYDVSNPDILTANDIETIRSIFDSADSDSDGCVTFEELLNLYKSLGEPLTKLEAESIILELDPNDTNLISFNTFLNWWFREHKGGKMSKSYTKKFKFLCAGLKGDFDDKKLIIKHVGNKHTTEYRITFHYEQNNGRLKQISPWHDIPLHHFKKQNVFNFICEVPKWTRSKFEIATGEEMNPIHQDVKNGKLRFYQHGDMFFNYGAFPQTWENPNIISPETGYPGDNDPLDVIEFGTRQLKTGSVTPVKVLGVLGLLDSGETDWKILAININDPLANVMNDVHDMDKHIPGAIIAIREYLKIYKVCTGHKENKYAFRGEALNQEYALKIIGEAHEDWAQINQNKGIVMQK